MTAVGSRDGRDIVLTLDGLRNSGLDRDDLGRYVLKPKITSYYRSLIASGSCQPAAGGFGMRRYILAAAAIAAFSHPGHRPGNRHQGRHRARDFGRRDDLCHREGLLQGSRRQARYGLHQFVRRRDGDGGAGPVPHCRRRRVGGLLQRGREGSAAQTDCRPHLVAVLSQHHAPAGTQGHGQVTSRTSRASRSPATVRVRSRPTKSARCWRRPGFAQGCRDQNHPLHPDGHRAQKWRS